MSGFVGWTTIVPICPSCFQTCFQVLPASVRLVDAVAGRDVAADVGLAGADVDDVRVGRGDGDRADRRDRLVVEDRLPVDAAVVGLPDAAGGRGRVVGERIARHAGDPRDPPAGRRADRAVVQAGELRRRLGRLVIGQDGQGSQSAARPARRRCEVISGVRGSGSGGSGGIIPDEPTGPPFYPGRKVERPRRLCGLCPIRDHRQGVGQAVRSSRRTPRDLRPGRQTPLRAIWQPYGNETK